MVATIEITSRKPIASTTPSENTRLRSHAGSPVKRCFSLRKIRLSAPCSWANTTVAPTNSSAVLHRPASEPMLGWSVALRITVSATVPAPCPASSPIWSISDCCAGGYIDAVIHSSSTSSGASDSSA